MYIIVVPEWRPDDGRLTRGRPRRQGRGGVDAGAGTTAGRRGIDGRLSSSALQTGRIRRGCGPAPVRFDPFNSQVSRRRLKYWSTRVPRVIRLTQKDESIYNCPHIGWSGARTRPGGAFPYCRWTKRSWRIPARSPSPAPSPSSTGRSTAPATIESVPTGAKRTRPSPAPFPTPTTTVCAADVMNCVSPSIHSIFFFSRGAGIFQPRNNTQLKSPRYVSTNFIKPAAAQAANFTLALMSWGQFITHDITRSSTFTSGFSPLTSSIRPSLVNVFVYLNSRWEISSVLQRHQRPAVELWLSSSVLPSHWNSGRR